MTFANSMVDTSHRTWELAPRISHWVFEAVPGQIRGCDGQGRVLMAIEAGPAFGQRLAAAFDAGSGARYPGVQGSHPRVNAVMGFASLAVTARA